MSDAQAPELKACPFCGSSDIQVADWFEENGGHRFNVGCTDCGAETSPSWEVAGQARGKWNTRADLAHPPIASGITDGELEGRALAAKAWGALNFILAFYGPGQTYLDTNAWKQAEASGRRVHAELREFLDRATLSRTTDQSV